MIPKPNDTGSLRPQELEAIYAISNVVAEAVDIDTALDTIVGLARPVFIFDNAVLYQKGEENGTLEATFARAIGRGRSSEADLAWGEVAAKEAIDTAQNYLNEPKIQEGTDRLDQRFYLGLPMMVGGKVIGALVFIRFGGPPFTDDQINLATFIAEHVSQLLRHQQLVERIASLEAERRLAKLQDEFIATMSHEINTPIGFIKGYTTTLLRDDTQWDPDTTREFLTIIDDETDRLSELIDNLLDSSRLQAGTLRFVLLPIDLRSLIDEILHRVRTRYTNLDILVHIDPSDLKIQADAQRLAQVIDNLLSNAVKYAPRSTIIISISANDEWVTISIEDNGPGIPAEHLDHLFERFYRVPERSAGVRGSGLGLYICDHIVRSHGGKMDVKSTVGEGTTFYIHLPIKHNQEPET
jgi:signal transduction histidine kinase